MRAWGRCLRRLVVFGVILSGAFLRFLVVRRHRSPAGRARWLHDTCRAVAAGIGLDIRPTGPAIARGLIVANHLGYLDVIVIAALHPSAFLSKQEVRAWPLIGWAARAAGTIFVRRENRGDIARAAAAIGDRLAAGGSVIVFPEGTSTDGAQVRPFHPGAFAAVTAVAGSAVRITPIHLSYRRPDGAVAAEAAYWGDMTFAPHLLRVLGAERITADVRIGEAFPAAGDRKHLARLAHEVVTQLAVPGGERGFPAGGCKEPTPATTTPRNELYRRSEP